MSDPLLQVENVTVSFEGFKALKLDFVPLHDAFRSLLVHSCFHIFRCVRKIGNQVN